MMRLGRNAYVMLLVTFLIAGCSPQAKFRTTDDGRYIPEGLGDSLPNHETDKLPNNVPDYNAIYMTNETRPNNRVWIHWYRFWENGRVLRKGKEQTSFAVPTLGEAEDFSHASVGRYTIANGQIVMEFWAPNSSDSGWAFYTFHAVAQGTDAFKIISVTEQAGRPGQRQSKPRHDIYQRFPVDTMKRKPDW